MEPITFPDAESLVVAYLNPLLTAASDTARAATSVPNPRPPRLVRVVRTGGGRRGLAHEDARITVECWAPTSPEASDLARTVRGWLWAMDVSTDGTHAHTADEVGGPASLPDPDSRTPRYVFTVTIRQRAQLAPIPTGGP